MNTTKLPGSFHIGTLMLVLVGSWAVASEQAQSGSNPQYGDEIRGYKVERSAKLTGQPAAASDESIINLAGLIELGQVKLGALSLERLNLEIPITIRPIQQKGEVQFMVFDQMTLNRVPFTVSEYQTPFRIPNTSALTLPRNVELHLTYANVARTALVSLVAPEQPLRIQGNVLVFGRFKRLGLSFKRVVPLSFSFERPNPLADYAVLKRVIGDWSVGSLTRSERTRVARPVYLKIEEDQEIRLSNQWAADMEQKFGVFEDPTINQYLDDVGQRLARASQRPGLRYTFKIINSYDQPSTAAFTIGGGHVFVLRSALDYMESEAELAFVVGHEIGHNAGYHVPLQVQRRMILDKVVDEIALTTGKVPLPDVAKLVDDYTGKASAFVLLQFSRHDEEEADILAVGDMFDAGYDPRVGLQWAKNRSRSIREWIEGWNDTHPSPEERFEYLSAELAKLGTKPNLIVNTDAFNTMKDRLKSLPREKTRPLADQNPK